jgi:hypothetical protein
MKHVRKLVVLALGLGLVAACSGSDSAPEAAAPTLPGGAAAPSVYFGWVLGTPQITAVAFDVAAPDAQGNRMVRAYVCDGLGPPAGKALWFTGSVDPESTTTGGQTVPLPSAGGNEVLTIDHLSERAVSGAFTNAAGERAQFIAYPGTDGAGIYEVTLSEDLRYTGISTDGSRLEATTNPEGRTEGTITTAAGKTIEFVNQSLALASPAALSSRGLPDTFTQFVDNNQVPGEYVAVIAPGGSHWLGRSGNVRAGSPGANIIGLDKKC